MALSARIELQRGGRIASLRSSSGHEWLWHRLEASHRDGIGPSGSFVDIGGVDECIPTISGTPDHGAVWSRAWEGSDENAIVTTEEFELPRQIAFGNALVLGHRLLAEPGYEFIWLGMSSSSPNPVWSWTHRRGTPFVPGQATTARR